MTLLKVSLLVGLMTMAAGAGSIATAENREPSEDTIKSMAGDDCGAERCISVARGLVDFFDRRLHGLMGNGRACADCHMPNDSTWTPPHCQAFSS